jgi:hypothetical protein
MMGFEKEFPGLRCSFCGIWHNHYGSETITAYCLDKKIVKDEIENMCEEYIMKPEMMKLLRKLLKRLNL